MTKIYMVQKYPSTNPLIEGSSSGDDTNWVEKFALRALKFALICLIITMGFLVLTQQLLNRELSLENDRLRKLVNDKLHNELISHPFYEKYKSDFEKFKEDFNKKYEDEHEETRRKLIFLNRLQEIEELNSEENLGSTEYGINEFADMTDEEFKKLLLPLDYYKNLRKNAKFIKEIDNDFKETALKIPPRFDWREKGVVTPVKNQNGCGSCWAFATVATVESNYAIAHGTLKNLSEQELLDCNLENNACNGGDVDKAFRFVHEQGLMTEDAYPYVAHRQNSCALAGDDKTKIDVAYWLNPTEDAIIDWLLTYGPVNVGISVPPTMKPYKGGVYSPSPYDCKFRVLGLHALLIVGYDQTEEGEKYWIVKNSWGQSYGIENGYVRFARGINSCGIEDEPLGILA